MTEYALLVLPSTNRVYGQAAPALAAAELAALSQLSLGGRVTDELPIVGGFSAVVPGVAVPKLAAAPDVLRVWRDGLIHMSTVDMDQYDSYPINTVWRTTINLVQALTKTIGLGVGVAVLDTGTAQVPDLPLRQRDVPAQTAHDRTSEGSRGGWLGKEELGDPGLR